MSTYPTLRCTDAQATLRFLVDAFGFTEKTRMQNPDGTIAHAELSWPDGGLVMLGQRGTDPSPFDNGVTCVYLTLDDPDGHHDRAVAAGAKVVMELTDQEYGSREYAATDPDGNVWCFGTYRP